MSTAMTKESVETTSQLEARLAKAAAEISRAVSRACPDCHPRLIEIGGPWSEMRGPTGYSYEVRDSDGERQQVQIDLAERRAAFLKIIQAGPDLERAMVESGAPWVEIVEIRCRQAMTPALDSAFRSMMTSREDGGRLLKLIIAGREWLLSPEGSPHGLAGRLVDLRTAAAWCRQHPEALPGRHRPAIEKLAAEMEREGNELHDALLSMTWPELEALAAKIK